MKNLNGYYAMGQQPQKTSLMWAYGSNLCLRQMAYRCPGAKKIKALPVYGAKLVFRGVADVQITNNPQDVALGGLWRITANDERVLDRYEGVRSGMYTKEYFYIRDKSRHYHKVLYYKMASDGIFPPGEGYLGGIVEGYGDFGLDLTKLDEAVRHAWDDKNKTDDMRQRYLRDRPELARTITDARRPMISAPPPKPRRPVEAKVLSADPRQPPAPKAETVGKHWPQWPSLGPDSKLLPKPRSEQKAPPLESLFPGSDHKDRYQLRDRAGTIEVVDSKEGDRKVMNYRYFGQTDRANTIQRARAAAAHLNGTAPGKEPTPPAPPQPLGPDQPPHEVEE